MLRLTKKFHGTVNISVLDSGLCFLQGLVDIKKKWVYGDDHIKKRHYLPHYIDGNKIKDHFNDKDVGVMDALHDELENMSLFVFAMKEEDCVVILISTFGKNERVGEDEFRMIDGEIITFK